jgi:hypothetical protein
MADAHLLGPARQLCQIYRSPEPPRGESGKLYSENLSHACVVADRSELFDRLEPERLASRAVDGGLDVLRRSPSG